jgi:hypothetical protein
MYLKGIILSPLYLIMAGIAGAPGIGIHLRSMAFGARLLLSGRVPLKMCYHYIFFPMDSTRYPEFHEVWKSLKSFPFSHYLDVSSPRLMPLLLLKEAPNATAVMINPDVSDMQDTGDWQRSWVEMRCGFQRHLEDAKVAPASLIL